MNNTNLKQIEKTTNIDLMELLECTYEQVDGFEDWIVRTLNLTSLVWKMTKDEMIEEGVWQLVFDALEEVKYDEKPGGLTILINKAWKELEGFKEWILKYLEIDEYVSDMGAEFVQDERDLELVLEILK